MLSRRGFLRLMGLSAIGAASLGTYAAAIEPLYRLNTTSYRLSPRHWPAGQRLRIVALADVHACEPWMPAERVARICAHANTLGADVIVLLGDYMSGMRLKTGDVPPEEWARAMSILRAPHGVHAICGNHDWWEDADAQRFRRPETIAHRVLRAAGITVHSNTAVRLGSADQPYWIAGLEDQLAYLNSDAVHGISGLDDLQGTLAQITDTAPVILLAHEPDIFPTVPERVSLTLSGHTHGGQVNLFGWTPVVPSRYGSRYAYGHVIEQDRHLVVSRGLGCSIAPIRLGAPPEIVVIDVG